MRTPNPHQSTALVYEVSVNTEDSMERIWKMLTIENQKIKKSISFEKKNNFH